MQIGETETRESLNKKLSSRRLEALAVAEQCARVLKDDFGAKQVILFGSVVGQGPWHEGSDLDLAVEGLSAQALREAEKELETISPPWLEVDLVPLEHVYPEVRSYILGEKPMPDDVYLALKTRLEDEIVNLERVAQGVVIAIERAGEQPDEFAIRALASYVEDFYKGCERICERVAVALDDGLPQGERWHQVLLGRMGERGGKGRPVLFDGSLLLELDEYRRFRHRIRHVYGYELEAERVFTLAQGVKPVLEQVEAAVATFNTWLEEQAGREE
jgi:predicted nucleotidyltransferase